MFQKRKTGFAGGDQKKICDTNPIGGGGKKGK
jgi:hypothetical protein